MSESADETGEIEELGSVGDWSIPSWVPRLPRLAWLFIGLAILSVVAQLAPFVSGYGWAFSLDPHRATGAIATSLPILLPAAVLWRASGQRPRVMSTLAIGSIAIAVGALLASVVSASGGDFDRHIGNSYIGEAYDYVGELNLIAVLGFVGPVLLGRAIHGLRGNTATRWARPTGVVLSALTVLYIVLALTYMHAFYSAFVDPDEYPGGLFALREAASRLLDMLSVIGWAYFAWVVISASGHGKRPRMAWHLAVAAVVIRQLVLALNILPAAIGLVASPSGEANVLTDLAVAIYLVVFIATPPLAIAASVLLITAFATGFGNPRVARPDAPPVELEPIPNPG